MSILTVASKGQIVLPSALRVLQPSATFDLSQLAGMVKAPSRGKARKLEDFQPALDSIALAGGRHE